MKRKNKKVTNSSGITVIISDKVKDHSNDPFFKKKDEEADAFLRKHPIPKDLFDKK